MSASDLAGIITMGAISAAFLLFLILDSWFAHRERMAEIKREYDR